jgi:hypothetical protein
VYSRHGQHARDLAAAMDRLVRAGGADDATNM